MITGNTSGYYGGGLQIVYSSSPILENNVITGNTAVYWGGGVLVSRSSVTINGCTISENFFPSLER